MPTAMNRLFLAILALFAGLAAQAPAQARASGPAEIGAVYSELTVIKVAGTIAAAAGFGRDAEERIGGLSAEIAHTFQTVLISPVLVGLDRAHE